MASSFHLEVNDMVYTPFDSQGYKGKVNLVMVEIKAIEELESVHNAQSH